MRKINYIVSSIFLATTLSYADLVVDTTFGTDGNLSITNPFNTTDYNLKMIQEELSDGSYLIGFYGIVDSGDTKRSIKIIKLNSDMTQDSSFCGSGEVKILNSLDIQDGVVLIEGLLDGGFLVAYSSTNGDNYRTIPYIMLARYDSSCNIVNSFGTNGIKELDITAGTNDIVHAILELSDGSILVGGETGATYQVTYGATTYDMVDLNSFLVKVDSSGNLDSTFNNNSGVYYEDLDFADDSTRQDKISKLMLDSNNKVFALVEASDTTVSYAPTLMGTTPVNSGTYNSKILMKFNQDGTLDTSFGTGGKKAFKPTVEYADLIKDENDNFFVASNKSSNDPTINVYKLDSNASLDTTYGNGGRMQYVFSTNYTSSYIKKLTLLNSGAIAFFGTITFGSAMDGIEKILYGTIDNSGVLDGNITFEDYNYSLPYARDIVSKGNATYTLNYSLSKSTDLVIVKKDYTPLIVNSSPVITEGERVWISLNEDTNTSFTLNATDSENDDLNWSIDTNGTYGVASVSSTPSGTSQTITYTPEGNYSGGDNFVVKVADAYGSDTIDVHIAAKPIQDKPIVTSLLKSSDMGQSYVEVNSTDTIYEDSLYIYKLELVDYDKEGLKVNPITLPSSNSFTFIDSNASTVFNTITATLTTDTTFNNPKYLALYNNYLYISDQSNHLIKRINLTNDNNQSEIFAGNGNDGGSTCVGNVDKLQATLSAPAQLFFDNYGVLFVADATCNSIYRIDSNNSLSIVVTDTGDADGVLVDEDGTIYYSDSTSDKIVKVENGNKTDLATALNGPDRMAFDNSGNILFSDIGTDTIKKVNLSDNSVSVVIGDGNTGEAPDGTVATSGSINNPRGVWGADNGDIYFADMGNNKIKRVNSSDGKIYSVVDLSNLSSSPYSFAFDTNRTMYIDGKSDDVIKKVNFYTLITATPTNDDIGTHTLELNISDGINSIVKEINITVVNRNDTPTIDSNITYSTQVTGATTIDWKNLSNANDVDVGDILTAVQKNAPSKGTISINENNVTYTPFAKQSGSDEFNLTISDTNNSSVDVVVSITNIDTSSMPVTLNYVNTLEESSSNDGSMSGSVVITLSGESFADNVVSSNYVNASHLPSELDAKFERNSSTQITMTLNYNALEHLSSSYSDITISFSDSAFKNLNASDVTDSNKSISVTFYDGIISGLTPNVWQMVSVPTNIVVDTTTLSSQIVSGSSIWAYRNKTFVENPTDTNAKEGLWVKPNSNALKINATINNSYDYGYQYAQLKSWKCDLSANEWNFMGVEYATNWSDLTRNNITPDNGCVYTVIFNYDHNNDSWNSTDSISANSAIWLQHICTSTPSCDNNNINGR